MFDARHPVKHDQDQDRAVRRCLSWQCWRLALRYVSAVSLLLSSFGCSKIPQGRSAIDAVDITNAHAVGAGEIEEKLATQASPRFLFLFQGVAYDYAVYDEAVLQRDMARIERVYHAYGFFDAHARVAYVRQVAAHHVSVNIVVNEGPPTLNRNVTVVGTESLPRDVALAVIASG